MNQATSTTAPQTRGWVLFTLAGLTLAVNQRQVRRIVPAGVLETDQSQAVRFNLDGEDWPVFALDQHLRPTSPASQRFAVFLEALHRPLGVLADSVRILPQEDDLKPLPIPPCMQLPDSPLTALALLEGNEVVLISDAQSITWRLPNDDNGERV